MEITVSKKSLKKTLAVFMAILIAISSMSLGVSAEASGEIYDLAEIKANLVSGMEDGEVIKTILWGDNVVCTLYDNGSLVVEGNGEMQAGVDRISGPENIFESTDYDDIQSAELVERIWVKSGITAVGSGVFRYFYNLEYAVIDEGVTRIDPGVFGTSPFLKTIYLPGTIEQFDFDTRLSHYVNEYDYPYEITFDTVYYNGYISQWIDVEKSWYNNEVHSIKNADIICIDGIALKNIDILKEYETKKINIETDEMFYLKFVPENTGVYQFEYYTMNDDGSLNYSGEGDLYSYVYDANWDVLANGFDFGVDVKLEAGETYYLGVASYDGYSGYCSVFGWFTNVECYHNNITYVDEVVPSCTTKGCSMGEICNDCGEVLYGCEEIEYLHTDDNDDEICDDCGSDIELIASGSSGHNSQVEVYNDGTLVFSGSGELRYGKAYSAPYEDIYVRKVKICEGIDSIGGCFFENCENLISVELPDTLISIYSEAFSYCYALNDISIPDSVRTIEADAFKASGVYNNPNNWEGEAFYIGKYLIEMKSTSIKDFTVKDGTLLIADSAFTIVNKKRDISKSILESITIPASVKSIGNSAFGNCNELEALYYNGTIAQWNEIDYSDNYKYSLDIYCTDGIIRVDEENYGNVTDGNVTDGNVTDGNVGKCSHRIREEYFAVSPDCENEGISEGVYCAVCQTWISDREVVSAKGHSYYIVESKAATCTDDGYNVYACHNDESHGYSEVIKRSGHDEVYHEGKAATCTETGWDAYITCSKCDYSTFEEIPALKHKETVLEAKTPTCTETGLTEGKYCSVCKEILVEQETIDAQGHDMGEFVVVEDATCTVEGKKKSVCSRCDFSEFVKIELKSHLDEDDDGYCDVCKEFIADENCICVCHAKTIGKFVYRILLFIDKFVNVDLVYKVFGVTEICACGKKH